MFCLCIHRAIVRDRKKIISVKQSRNNGSDNHSREFQQYLRQHGYFLLINKSTVLIFLCLLPDYFSCELLVWFQHCSKTDNRMKHWNLILFLLYTLHCTLDHTPMCLGKALINVVFWENTHIPCVFGVQIHRIWAK